MFSLCFISGNLEMAIRNYWWLVTQDQGKNFLVFGSDKSEEDARQKGFELLGGIDFEIKRLPTRSLSQASSLLKGNRLEQYHSLREASKRLGHDKSIKYLRRRHLINNF